MRVTERDKIASKTLIEVLNKAKYEVVGSEAIVVARIMEWASELSKRILEDLQAPPAPTLSPESAALLAQGLKEAAEGNLKPLKKSKKSK